MKTKKDGFGSMPSAENTGVALGAYKAAGGDIGAGDSALLERPVAVALPDDLIRTCLARIHCS